MTVQFTLPLSNSVMNSPHQSNVAESIEVEAQDCNELEDAESWYGERHYLEPKADHSLTTCPVIGSVTSLKTNSYGGS